MTELGNFINISMKMTLNGQAIQDNQGNTDVMIFIFVSIRRLFVKLLKIMI